MAQVWTPVEDGYHYVSISNDRIDVGYPKAIEGKCILVVGQDDEDQNIELIVLPDNIRLCHLVEVEQGTLQITVPKEIACTIRGALTFYGGPVFRRQEALAWLDAHEEKEE